MAVLAKALDQERSQGQAALQLLQGAAQTAPVTVPQAGTGSRVDVSA